MKNYKKIRRLEKILYAKRSQYFLSGLCTAEAQRSQRIYDLFPSAYSAPLRLFLRFWFRLGRVGLLRGRLIFFLLVFLFHQPIVFASRRLKVVCTIFPIYLFAKDMVGDRPEVSLELLLPPDMGCPHDYALTPGDIKKLFRADLLLVNGLGMEEFLSPSRLRLMGHIRIMEVAAGVEPTLSNNNDKKHHHDSNPHLFASPRKAVVYVRNIAKALSFANPNENYKKNAEQLILRLEKLDLDLKTIASGISNKKVVVFHDSLEYLLRDAGLDVINVDRHEKMISAREAVRLIQLIKKSRPVAIFSDSQYSAKMVKMLSGETGVPHFSLDSVAGGTGYEPGYYETAMRKNIEILKTALGFAQK